MRKRGAEPAEAHGAGGPLLVGQGKAEGERRVVLMRPRCFRQRTGREIARELNLSKNTVMDIVKRASPAAPGEDEAA